MAAPYRVLKIDLGTATVQPLRILDPGIPIGDVAVLQLPAAAVGAVFLRIGSAYADQIPLRLEGQNFHVYGAREQGGVFLDIPTAFPGATLVVFVGIATALEPFV